MWQIADPALESDSELESVLAELRAAAAAAAPPAAAAEPGSASWGRCVHQGLPARWRLHTLPDGSFLEEITSAQVSHRWAYSPDQHGGALWEVDHTGLGHALELDDREVALLSCWARCPRPGPAAPGGQSPSPWRSCL